MNGNEAYFNAWLSTMKNSGHSMTMIKSETEKLDDAQYSVLHYAIRYHHWNLSRMFIEEFHCGLFEFFSQKKKPRSYVFLQIDVNLVGCQGEIPLHTAARSQQLNEVASDNKSIVSVNGSHRFSYACLLINNHFC
jgi:hypothetical protein